MLAVDNVEYVNYTDVSHTLSDGTSWARNGWQVFHCSGLVEK